MQLRDRINSVTLIHANIARQDDFRGIVGTKLLILDECQIGSIKYDDLNSIADGTYRWRVKNGAMVELGKILIIVNSNCTIEECFPYQHTLVHARFTEVDI